MCHGFAAVLSGNPCEAMGGCGSAFPPCSPAILPTMKLSRRVSDLKVSATISVMNRAKDLARQGVDVLSFAAGEPDFDTPEPIKQAAIKALLAGQTKYMPTMGDMETRAAIAEKV